MVYASFEPTLNHVTGPTTAGIQFFYIVDQNGQRIWEGGDVNGSIGAYSAEIVDGKVNYLELRSHNEYDPSTYGWTPVDQINAGSPDLTSSTYWYGNDLTIAQMYSGEEIAFKFKRIYESQVYYHPVTITGKFGNAEDTMLINAKTTGSLMKDNMINTYGSSDPYIKFTVNLDESIVSEELEVVIEEDKEAEEAKETVEESKESGTTEVAETNEPETTEEKRDTDIAEEAESSNIPSTSEALNGEEEVKSNEETKTEDPDNIVITLLGLNVDVMMGMKAETLAFPSVSEIFNLPIGVIKVSTQSFKRAFQFKPPPGTPPSQMETTGMKFRFNRNSSYPNSVQTTQSINNPMKGIFPLNNEEFSNIGNISYPQLVSNIGDDTTEQPKVPYEYKDAENSIPHDYVKCIAHQCFGSPANYVTLENLSTLYSSLESNSVGPMNEVWSSCKSPSQGTPGLDVNTGIYEYKSGVTGDAAVLQYPTLISNWMYNQIKSKKSDRLLSYDGIPDSDGFYEMPLRAGDVISFKMTIEPSNDQHKVTSVFTDDEEGRLKCKKSSSRAYEILFYMD